MAQQDRRMCLDVSVKRGAECNTDHRLLCAKIRLSKGMHKRKAVTVRVKRYDVTKLLESHESCGGNDTVMRKERFVEQVLERDAESWPGSRERKIWRKYCVEMHKRYAERKKRVTAIKNCHC